MKAIVFGAGGQDGRLLSGILDRNNVEVIGVGRATAPVQGDVADASFVDDMLTRHTPDYIFHFAATSSTHHSALFDNHRAISTGTLNILESARKHCPQARIFLSGSALQFKNEGAPISEETPFEASSPYSVARIHSVFAGRYFRSAFGMKVYFGFLFHHDSPLRTEQHVNQKIVRAVQRIAAGSKERLELGDVSVKKEFNYAGDVVEAIWLLVNQNDVFEVIVGCGEAHSIKEWVEYCFQAMGQDWSQHVAMKGDFKAEYRRLVSDPSRLRALSWRPKVSFHQLADMMLEAHDFRV